MELEAPWRGTSATASFRSREKREIGSVRGSVRCDPFPAQFSFCRPSLGCIPSCVLVSFAQMMGCCQSGFFGVCSLFFVLRRRAKFLRPAIPVLCACFSPFRGASSVISVSLGLSRVNLLVIPCLVGSQRIKASDQKLVGWLSLPFLSVRDWSTDKHTPKERRSCLSSLSTLTPLFLPSFCTLGPSKYRKSSALAR